MLEEGDLPLPVKEHEKIARRLERKEREMQALQKELAASKATGERWISRSMAAEARAARAEATGTVLEKQSDSMAAQLQLMKTQKQAAVAAEVGRARELETALAMEGERVRLANLRAAAAEQKRITIPDATKVRGPAGRTLAALLAEGQQPAPEPEPTPAPKRRSKWKKVGATRLGALGARGAGTQSDLAVGGKTSGAQKVKSLPTGLGAVGRRLLEIG